MKHGQGVEGRSVTRRQRQVLELLASRRWPEGAPLNDLAREMKLAHESGVRVHLDVLVARGYVERRATAPHFKPAFITEAGRRVLGLSPDPQVFKFSGERLPEPLPVVAARCGSLIERPDEPDHIIEYLGEVFRSYRKGDEMLIAKGDSMVSNEHPEDSIFEGDRCLIRPEMWPTPGEVAYVEVEHPNGAHECTLKEFHYNEDTGLVLLRAYNPAYPTIELEDERVTVRGVVLEVVRQVRTTRRRQLHEEPGRSALPLAARAPSAASGLASGATCHAFNKNSLRAKSLKRKKGSR